MQLCALATDSIYAYCTRAFLYAFVNNINVVLFTGWMKIEVLLQQLFEMETDIDVTVNLSS